MEVVIDVVEVVGGRGVYSWNVSEGERFRWKVVWNAGCFGEVEGELDSGVLVDG